MQTSRRKTEPRGLVKPTSDGITAEDWQKVTQFAHWLVKATEKNGTKDRSRAKRRLLGLLQRLGKKYGPKPSLLATEADFMTWRGKRLDLWKRAYRLASASGDQRNCVLIAESLVEFFFEDQDDPKGGLVWLQKLKHHLNYSKDDYGTALLEKYTS